MKHGEYWSQKLKTLCLLVLSQNLDILSQQVCTTLCPPLKRIGFSLQLPAQSLWPTLRMTTKYLTTVTRLWDRYRYLATAVISTCLVRSACIKHTLLIADIRIICLKWIQLLTWASSLHGCYMISNSLCLFPGGLNQTSLSVLIDDWLELYCCLKIGSAVPYCGVTHGPFFKEAGNIKPQTKSCKVFKGQHTMVWCK